MSDLTAEELSQLLELTTKENQELTMRVRLFEESLHVREETIPRIQHEAIVQRLEDQIEMMRVQLDSVSDDAREAKERYGEHMTELERSLSLTTSLVDEFLSNTSVAPVTSSKTIRVVEENGVKTEVDKRTGLISVYHNGALVCSVPIPRS